MLQTLQLHHYQPLAGVRLAFTLLVAFAVWRVGAALLRQLTPHLGRGPALALAWLWGLACGYAALAAGAYSLDLREVPLLWEQGKLVAAGFRASSGQLVTIGAIAFIAWKLVTLAVRRLVPGADPTSAFSRRTVRVQTLSGVAEGTLRVAIALLTGISALQALGVNASALLAGVSVLGLAVGFGAQSLIKDLFSGFFILLEDQYGVGDIIAVNNSTLSGGVERLTLRLTVLRALDGTVHLIPNGQIQTVSVSSKDWSQVVATVNVGPSADLDRALEVLEAVTGELYRDPAWAERFLAPPDLQSVTRLTADGVELRALLKVTPKSQYPVGREFNRRIKLAMDEVGIAVHTS
ncbi:MAG: mechanosensitive ion channel family protein [Deinococcus sp.]